MKTILIVAAALGLSVPIAAADCPMHSSKQVLASTDKQTTTAIVADNEAKPTVDTPIVIQKDEKAKAE
jgi:hypothetical protein